MLRLTTASPRYSSRSLWPRAASGCSWNQLEWTRACSRRSRSWTSRPRLVAKACPGLTPAGGDSSLGRVLVDVIDRVLDGPDLLRVLVRDLRSELLFEAHDPLDQAERIRVQVVDERRVRLDLILVGAELLDDDLLEALVRCGHGLPPRSWVGRRSPRARHSSGVASGLRCRCVPARPTRRWPPGPACRSVAPHRWRFGATHGPSWRGP